MARRFGNYWAYSIGLGAALAAVAEGVAVTKPDNMHTFLFVSGGFALGWVSSTIARYIYPPVFSSCSWLFSSCSYLSGSQA
jgi:hypothetical protein